MSENDGITWPLASTFKEDEGVPCTLVYIPRLINLQERKPIYREPYRTKGHKFLCNSKYRYQELVEVSQ